MFLGSLRSLPFYPQVLIKLIKPYTRINIEFISKELNVDAADVESLLVSCILDSTIQGRIDQVMNAEGQSPFGIRVFTESLGG